MRLRLMGMLKMWYVEFLRVRRAFTIFAIAFFCVVAFTTTSVEYGLHHAMQSSHEISIGSDSGHKHMVPMSPHVLSDLDFQVPLGMLFFVASGFAMLLGTTLGTSLNKENGRGGFAFTKPVGRTTLALGFVALDLATIFLAFLYVTALVVVSLAILGISGKLYLDPNAFAIAAVGLGAAAMWYGILQAATSVRTSAAGLFIGLSWPFFFLAEIFYGIQYFGPIFHGLFVAIDFFNPLSYIGFSDGNHTVTTTSILGFAPAASIAITWALALVAIVVAITGWKRVEV